MVEYWRMLIPVICFTYSHQNFSLLHPSILTYSQSCSWWWQTVFFCSLYLNLKVNIRTRSLPDTVLELKKNYIRDHLVLCRLWPSLPIAAYFLWLTGGTSLWHRSEALHSFPEDPNGARPECSGAGCDLLLTAVSSVSHPFAAVVSVIFKGLWLAQACAHERVQAVCMWLRVSHAVSHMWSQ